MSLTRSLALADAVGLVRFEAVEAQAVFFGIHRNGAQSELIGGPQNADGDLATVECKQFFHLEVWDGSADPA